MHKLLFAIALISTNVFSVSVDIELDRYPFLSSKALTNHKLSNDLDTIRYTRVFRYAPTSHRDLNKAKTTYKRNDLSNNSLIGIPGDYPSWLIDEIKVYNNGKKSEDLIRVFGKAFTFGPTLFTGHYYYKGKWYQNTRKVRKENGNKGTVTEIKSINSSKYVLTHKEYQKRPVFAFNPIDFDTDQDHTLKIQSNSKLYADTSEPQMIGPMDVAVSLAGKELKFLKAGKDSYKYRLTCDAGKEDTLERCRRELVDHYNKRPGKSPREIIDQYLSDDRFEVIQKACYFCEYEPYFQLSDPDQKKLGQRQQYVTNIKDKSFVPSRVFTKKSHGVQSTYKYYHKEAKLYSELIAIDKEFSFMKDLLIKSNQFQTMISRVGGRDIKSVTYPRNAYGSYHYSREAKRAKAQAKTLLNPYAACMFQKVQKEHLAKIISSDYFALHNNFSQELHTCLKKNHPDIAEEKLRNINVITKLFEQSNHPCSDHIMNTGIALQYGDMGIAYNFKTFHPHESHKQGRCIDARPMRQTHIDRASFREKLIHELNIVKNSKVINDINRFTKTLAQNPYVLEGLRSTDFYLEKKIPSLFKSEKDENGKHKKVPVILKYAKLSQDTKKFVMGEYINHLIDLHDKGKVSPAISAYFTYSVFAVDSKFYSIKDENTTNDFIRLLKEEGADHNTIAYSKGSRTLGRSSHNRTYYKLGLELTKNWKNHNDHIHFCFDYNKTEATLKNILSAKKNLKTAGKYAYQATINQELNKGIPDSFAIDHFQGLSNKIDCLKYVPSEFNQDRKKEIEELRDSLSAF